MEQVCFEGVRRIAVAKRYGWSQGPLYIPSTHKVNFIQAMGCLRVFASVLSYVLVAAYPINHSLA